MRCSQENAWQSAFSNSASYINVRYMKRGRERWIQQPDLLSVVVVVRFTLSLSYNTPFVHCGVFVLSVSCKKKKVRGKARVNNRKRLDSCCDSLRYNTAHELRVYNTYSHPCVPGKKRQKKKKNSETSLLPLKSGSFLFPLFFFQCFKAHIPWTCTQMRTCVCGGGGRSTCAAVPQCADADVQINTLPSFSRLNTHCTQTSSPRCSVWSYEWHTQS